ncbi:IS3 family transposase, partial [Cupriavidus sp. IK-TO18]|nr:IS3 family transposase [Cupriavidus sp. IK-TO18]
MGVESQGAWNSSGTRRRDSGRVGGGECEAAQGAGRGEAGARYCKKSRGVLRQGITARYAFVSQWREVYPVKLMCRVLGVSRSGYYDWTHRPYGLSPEQERLRLAIRAAHKRTRQTYGTRRLQRELAGDGFVVGRDRLARLRKEMGIRCRQKRRFVATTRSAHNLPVAPNLLEQKFEADRPNAAWVTDITYIATDEGWLYLAGIK